MNNLRHLIYLKKNLCCLLLGFIFFTYGCSTNHPLSTGGVIPGLSTAEVVAVDVGQAEKKLVFSQEIEKNLGRFREIGRDAYLQGNTSYQIYLIFNAWMGIKSDYREKALGVVAQNLCLDSAFSIKVKSNGDNVGSWDPNRYELNHIEARIQCSGQLADDAVKRRLQLVEQRKANANEKIKEEESRRQRLIDQEKKEAAAANARREETCKSFGFKPETEFFSNCKYEIYRIDEQAKQNERLISELRRSAKADEAARQENLAIQRKMLEEQQFANGIRQMQNAANILNPLRSTVTCKWNDLTSTMVCN
jgi:hypothetical protein